MNTTTVEQLKELGFDHAANEIARKRILGRKLMLAYEHHRFVTPENVDRFNTVLMEKTKPKSMAEVYSGYAYETLKFTPIKEYANVPPSDVLEKISAAKKLGCFDDFEIATIQTVEVRPDPIVFGIVHGCRDRFFVAQWDSDVRIEDILRADEG